MFALFERTYEKNCYPHEDHWSAIAFGRYAEVMHRVFRHASSCEGGMLQSRAGDIKPENYIESRRKELAKPFRLPDCQIRLEVSPSLRAPIPEKSLDEVRQSLTKAGFEDRIEAIARGEVAVSLVADTTLLSAIYGEKGPLSLWRVLDVNDCSSVVVDADLALPARSAFAMDRMPEVQCYAVGRENRLVSIDAHPWHEAGWQYKAVGDFITGVAYAVETEAPGFAKRAIPAFRDILRSANPLPNETGIVIARLPEGVDDHYARTADELARGLGLADAEGRAPAQFRFRLGDIPVDPDGLLLYRLCGLRREQVTLSVPKQEDAVEALRPVAHTDLTQLALEWI
ncbi:hypothetical protein [Paraburkholderia sp. RL17-337-BIB-A]|uniref:hypothetical protein n=1 Tax=Paraburkholderia sp. RL17-337-BIB-A TaxID=3031636 RepID=UPI0038B6D4D7